MKVCCPANGFGLTDEYSSDSIAAYMSMLSGISSRLPSTAKLIEAFLIELAGLPEPSLYAHLSTWRVWQERSTAILNPRPPTKQGLPIEVLHPVFATFLHDVKSMQLDEWTPEDDVNSISIKLCEAMAGSFENEVAWRKELIALLHCLVLICKSNLIFNKLSHWKPIAHNQIYTCQLVGGWFSWGRSRQSSRLQTPICKTCAHIRRLYIM